MHYLNDFILEGRVYRANKYDFLLLKDLIEYIRLSDLNIKVREIKDLLVAEGWKTKKASVSTVDGYKSKLIWFTDKRLPVTRELPVNSEARKTLIQEEELEADRLFDILSKTDEIFISEAELIWYEHELWFTNKGLKALLENLGVRGSVTRVAALIRKKSEKILQGEHFYGVSSRTVLFRNFYKIKRVTSDEV